VEALVRAMTKPDALSKATTSIPDVEALSETFPR